MNSKARSFVNDELHLRLQPADKKRVDQNRLFAGIRLDIDSEGKAGLEVGYMLQTVRNSAETEKGRKRLNHIVRVTFISESLIKRR